MCIFVSLSVVVSVGGQDGAEAAAGICGVHRIQYAAAAAGHQLCRHTDWSVLAVTCVH